MTNRIHRAFDKGPAFVCFVSAGDPSLESTEKFVFAMEKAGADLIELGIPFSDPIAEGPVIQEANIRALAAGCTVEKIFNTVQNIRKKTQVPLVFLTYFNPIFRYGCDAFCARCAEVGADGIIVPDLPFEESSELRVAADTHGVALIALVAPTSENRIAAIAAAASGFLYVVSSLGVTGTRGEIKTNLKSIIDAAKKVTDTPCAVGFGINTPEQAAAIAKISDGVIVGSALVKIIAAHGENAEGPLTDYISAMKSAIVNRN